MGHVAYHHSLKEMLLQKDVQFKQIINKFIMLPFLSFSLSSLHQMLVSNLDLFKH